ncbi:MFS transporter [Denitrificimonas sp. JX-1]|uniref:MFS transporter n=1 Tax=Denitrificimonas halotolerans TaxID=3098930 RepID=A0ABU5GPE1_9GAMM|nr:MFS transporter [Denitrificimonas sp. JX-1]MDY7218813.1 MFS transporter [Denitrificimonas sp. JX-1]
MQPIAHQSKQADNAWRVLFLLFLANVLNYFDRVVPSIVMEPIRLEWNLSDFQIGVLGTVFTIVYGVAGVPVARMADIGARKKIMGWGLMAWSVLTAANGVVQGFWGFLLARMGVGIGEASYGPAANSLIGDLFPAHRRARAMGVFMMGLPLGLLLAFFTTGVIVETFASWRAPFFIAAVPGIILALFVFMIREPARGAAEAVVYHSEPVRHPILRILATPTMWWLTLSGLCYNFATYSNTSFMVPMLQRYFGLELNQAAMSVGVIVGVTGLFALPLGGWIADRLHLRLPNGRLLFGGISLLITSLCTGIALLGGKIDVVIFVGLFAVGWVFAYNFYTCVYTAVQDVVEPRLRATAMALFFAGLYLLGGGLGPVIVGGLSDHFAEQAMLAAGALEMTEAFRAIGLHSAMYLVPAAMGLTGLFLLVAISTYKDDARKMTQEA